MELGTVTSFSRMSAITSSARSMALLRRGRRRVIGFGCRGGSRNRGLAVCRLLSFVDQWP